MEFFAYHGYYDAERTLGNKFGADVAVITASDEAGTQDELEMTVNYELLYQAVKDVMGVPVKLLETLALKIANRILADFPQVEVVEVKVCKFAPPIGGICREASVSLSKKRGKKSLEHRWVD